MKYIVTAVAFNHTTNEMVMEPREEVIDTEENVLFSGCTGRWDVEDQYEAFWNRLNDHWEDGFPSYKEKVKVISVVPA